MKTAWLTSLAAVFCLTGVAFAGEFQKTQDGRTLVWNNNPQAGDSATWSGKRDDEGYATGRGTLSWYRTEKRIVTGSNLPQPKRVPVASYTGEMVRGKLDGAVVAIDARGKKYHGTYAAGRRTKWLAGGARTDSPNEPAVKRGQLVESPSEGPRQPATEVKTAAPNQPQPPKETEAAVAPSPGASAAPQSANEFDDSLRSLIGPPSGLGRDEKAGARSTSSPAAGQSPEAGTTPSPP